MEEYKVALIETDQLMEVVMRCAEQALAIFPEYYDQLIGEEGHERAEMRRVGGDFKGQIAFFEAASEVPIPAINIEPPTPSLPSLSTLFKRRKLPKFYNQN